MHVLATTTVVIYNPNRSCRLLAMSIMVSSIGLYLIPSTLVNFEPSATAISALIFARADSSPFGTFLMSGLYLCRPCV